MEQAIIMPQVGQDIETAKILEWHVKKGDSVVKGDIIATVESDKASFEVEAFHEGTISRLLLEEGEEGKVFEAIAYLEVPDTETANGKTVPEITGSSGNIQVDNNEDIFLKKEEKDITNPSKIYISSRKIFASPLAKRIASENNISLEMVNGKGPDGRISKKDVIAFISGRNGGETADGRLDSADTEKSPRKEFVNADLREQDEVVAFSKMRKKIAEHLTYSKQNIPHFYLYADIDFSEVLEWRKNVNNVRERKISLNDILIKLVADSLKSFPKLNAHVKNEQLIIKKQINVGMAVSVEDGLLVPVISDADQKSLDEICAISLKNIENVRRGVMNNPDAGTFTVTNLGMYGITRFQAIINPPECAILSVGSIDQRVVPFESGIAIRSFICLGLACDHRVIDGAYAAGFLAAIREKVLKFSEKGLT